MDNNTSETNTKIVFQTCPKCNKEIRHSGEKCRYCGSNIGGKGLDRNQKTNRLKRAYWALLGILFTLFFIGIIYAATTNNEAAIKSLSTGGAFMAILFALSYLRK